MTDSKTMQFDVVCPKCGGSGIYTRDLAGTLQKGCSSPCFWCGQSGFLQVRAEVTGQFRNATQYSPAEVPSVDIDRDSLPGDLSEDRIADIRDEIIDQLRERKRKLESQRREGWRE